MKNNSIETINRSNNAWNSAIKLAINQYKLSKEDIKLAINQYKLNKEDIKCIWKIVYNKNKELLESKLFDLCFSNDNNLDKATELYEQISETNIFDLNNAIKFIESK